MNDYYVYVYFDPRNFQPFYYGKGRGSRKEEHKPDGDSRKAKRIKEIMATGLQPTIRVLACDLTEEQALLVESTLIWQAEGATLNEVAGHFASNFRPYRTLHRVLPGFDSSARVYYFNVGDGSHRKWEDNVKYKSVGAGHGKKYRQAIEGLREDDIVAVYLTGSGFVGVGRVTERAKPAREFRVKGKLLIDYPGMPEDIATDLRDDDKCEWMTAVEWIKSVPRSKAHFKKHAKLFAPQLVRASLAKQPKTVEFINERFGVKLFELANK